MLKASEYMRLGAMLRHQVRGELFSPDGGSCAMGALMEATGTLPSFRSVPELRLMLFGAANIDSQLKTRAMFPLLGTKPKLSPSPISELELVGLVWDVWGVCVHLNNICGWTRERIADYLETLEALEEIPAEVQRVAEQEGVLA